MQSQVTGIAQWTYDIESLADRGINQGLLQYLADMGPTGAGYVSAFVNMTDEELGRANQLFETSLVLPDATALMITDSFAKAGSNAAKGLAGGITSEINVVEDAAESMSDGALDAVMTTLDEHSPSKKTEEMGLNFDEGLKKGIAENKERVLNEIINLTTSMLDVTRTGVPTEEYKKIGDQIIEGMRNGIESGRSRVLESIRRLCEQAIQEAKDKLDIHSPSRAFAYLGEMSGEGYISGWEDTMRNINDVIADSLPDIPSRNLQSNEDAGLSNVAVSSQIYGMCEKMYNVMAQYLPGMSNIQVVTDTGALIGEITPRLDREFGEMEYDKSRGIYE